MNRLWITACGASRTGRVLGRMKTCPDMRKSVFDRASALAAGFTPGQLRGPSVKRLLHGIYTTPADPVKLSVRARAALLAGGEAARMCEMSSLALAGVELPAQLDADSRTHLHLPVGTCGPRHGGVRVHHTAVQLPVQMVGGLPSLHLAECWLQLAARASLMDLVVVGDGLMRRPRPPDRRPFLVTPEELDAAVQGSPRRPGIRVARLAATLVRPGTDSPMESVTRFRLVQAGLPEPLVNYKIVDKAGRPLFFLDMAYLAQLLAVEYDGRIHVGDVKAMGRGASRRRQLEDRGWRVITVTSSDLSNNMADVIASVRMELNSRGWRPAP